MYRTRRHTNDQAGFTLVEILVGIVVFAIMVGGLIASYNSIRAAYGVARQLNEMYTVLSACPEVDRALEFTSLTSNSNCYPNNTFKVENSASTGSITYTPTLTVTDASALDSSDPLRTVPDSKVVQIDLPFPKPYDNRTPLQLRMLITRNGIAQQ